MGTVVGRTKAHSETESGSDNGSIHEEAAAWVPAPGDPVQWQRLALDRAGRVLIPAPLREAMGAAPGSELLARVIEGELHLMTPVAAVARAQRMVREIIPGDDSLAESLIDDRRRESAAEKTRG